MSSPARAHVYKHTHTRPRAYARARTLAACQSVQSILGGLCPMAKRLEMRTIPGSPVYNDKL